MTWLSGNGPSTTPERFPTEAAHKVGLGALTRGIHPYPTQAEAIHKTGDAYNRTRLTPTVTPLFDAWLCWTRWPSTWL